MATITKSKEFAELKKKHINLKRKISIFVTGVDELFKSKPDNSEVGRTLAMLIEELEKSTVDD
jgi:hypothetical protein